jgi:redox-sensitive bicupin YhaK (pirin superfamily)
MHFSDLEVINDDIVQPGHYVPRHEHRNMEIYGYVVTGTCHHIDNQGNNVLVPAGAVQQMSSGKGIIHTEGNPSDHPIRYLQLWIKPEVLNTPCEYTWHPFTREDRLNQFCNITQVIPIKQHSQILSTILTDSINYNLETSRRYYVYIVTGSGEVNCHPFEEGDGFSFVDENQLTITVEQESEILLFDLR